jgi:DNA-directed RNA polymerase subunit RPC12/RpoP
MKKTIKCSNCGYIWETESKKKFVTCPDCLNKTIVEEYKLKEVKKEATR